MKNEAVSNKMKKKKKRKRKEKKKENGESDFINIWHTFVDNTNVTFHDPLRAKMAAGEKYKN